MQTQEGADSDVATGKAGKSFAEDSTQPFTGQPTFCLHFAFAA